MANPWVSISVTSRVRPFTNSNLPFSLKQVFTKFESPLGVLQSCKVKPKKATLCCFGFVSLVCLVFFLISTHTVKKPSCKVRASH